MTDSPNAHMNEMLLRAAGRGQPGPARTESGRFAAEPTMNDLIRQAVGGGGAPAQEDEHAAQLNAAMEAYQSALAEGDEVAAEEHDKAIETLLNEGRAAQHVSWNGGFQGRRRLPPPGGHWPETSTDLFVKAIEAAGAERAARRDDE